MSITSYTLKIKEVCDALRLINVVIDNDEMVQICLGGLAPRFNMIRSTILARENPPSFFDLQSILLVEENHMPDKGAMHPIARCSTPRQMTKEDLVEEIEVDSAEGNRVSQPENTTPTIGKSI